MSSCKYSGPLRFRKPSKTKVAPWCWTKNMIRLKIIAFLERKFPALPVILELRNRKIIFKAKSFSKLLYFFLFFPFFSLHACVLFFCFVLSCCFLFVFFPLKIKIPQYFPSLLWRTFFACETSGGYPATSVVEKSEVAVRRQHQESSALD